LRQHVVTAAQPKPVEVTFASDAHRRRQQADRSQRLIAPALVLLAGMVALAAPRVPAALAWGVAIAGAAWLLLCAALGRNRR
jgi:hypothetical protein